MESHDLDVRISSQVKTPVVRVIPLNDSEESHRIVREADIQQQGDEIHVTMPPGAGGGSMVISGGSVSINGAWYQGPVSVVNGVIRSHGVTGGELGSGARVQAIIPAGSVADLHSVSGDIRVEGDLSSFRGRTVSGNISATGVHQKLFARSTSGNVEVGTVSGEADITTVSGSVEIDSYGGKEITVQTVSGGIRIGASGGASGSMDVQTVSGGVRLQGVTLNRALDIRHHTVSGSIRKT
jgi:DUF4097 and DUF4098 domain-containing protein YvlB